MRTVTPGRAATTVGAAVLTVDYDRLGLEPGPPACWTWGPAPAATPSRPTGAAPGWWPSTTASASCPTCAALFAAMRDAGEAPSRHCGAAVNGDGTRLPFPDATFDRIICSEVLEHIPDDVAALRELRRVLKPGGTLAATVPAMAAREGVLEAVRRVPRPLRRGRPRAHLHRGRRCASRHARRRARAPATATTPTPCTRPTGGSSARSGPTNDDHPLVRAYHRLLVWDITKAPRTTRWTEKVLNPVLGKSLVVYARPGPVRAADAATAAPPRPRRLRPPRSGVSGPPPRRSTAVTPTRSGDRRRHRRVAAAQRAWSPGSRAATPIPWNHVEAAMALALGGRRRRGRAGLRVAGRPPAPRRVVAPVLPGRRRRAGQARRQRRRLRGRPACGTTGCSPATGASSRRMWPVVEPAIDFVLDLQTAAGRDPLGPPRRRHAVVRSPCSPARRASATASAAPSRVAERAGPRAARLGAVGGQPPGPRHPRPSPTPSPPSTAGPWTGTTRCCAACSPGDAGRARLAERSTAFVDRRPGRALRVGPALGHRRPRPASAPWPTWPSASGTPPTTLFGWAQQYREPTAAATGPAPSTPSEVHFPGGEQSTYTAAAVVLAADALDGTGPASALFVDHDACSLPSRAGLSRPSPG